MSRVTESEVRAVINTTISPLTPFIDMASLYVDDEFSDAPCMTEGRLKLMELWLAAHFIAVSTGDGGGQLKRVQVENILEREYATSAVRGGGIMSTRYGQTAITFDCTGKLVSVGKLNANLVSIGTL